MITIQKSETADTRTCDWSKVSKEQLIKSSEQHIEDVGKGVDFFIDMLNTAKGVHDFDKLSDIDGFHQDFTSGFETTEWWDTHRVVNRHHLLVNDGVPIDVDLVDVIEMIVDCVMAGKARSAGEVYPLEISPDVLINAFENTVELLKANVQVEDK